MARNHRSSRPASRPVATAPPQRQAHTAAAPMPPAQAPQVVHAPQGQGIMSQIATTAAGVAAGHLVGRVVGGLFMGGSESATAAPMEQTVGTPMQQFAQAPLSGAPQCQQYSKLFLQCMEQNGNQVSTCQDYMDMMKACQQQSTAA